MLNAYLRTESHTPRSVTPNRPGEPSERNLASPRSAPSSQRRVSSAWIRRLSGLAVALTLSLSAAGLASEQDSERESTRPQRPIGDIRKDVKAFVKRSKQVDDPVASVGAIIDLCHLHTEIVNDPRFDTNRQLKSFRAVAASRLKKYTKELELEIKRRQRRAELEARQARQAGQATPDSLPALGEEGTFTGNRLSGATETRGQEGAPGGFPSRRQEFEYDSVLSDSMAQDAYSMSAFGGGPVQVWTHVGGNFAPPWDHGPELVALIESTIDPQSWKSNGGDGVIHYYRPLRILVVSASSSVQDDLTNMLRNLRRLSR